ncbi:MAG: stage III sporulation protein AB [bacterium]|nr:stage III sporulation protein AB [bacterium]
MLLRVVGAAMVFLAGYSSGRVLSASLRRRPGELRDLQAGFGLLDTEVCHGLTPLPEALARVGRALPAPGGRVFGEAGRLLESGTPVSEAWIGAVEAFYPSSAWTGEDREAVASLAPVLGRSGREDQHRHLLLVRERLARQEAEARAQRDRYERLWSYLGALAGVGVVLVFL